MVSFEAQSPPKKQKCKTNKNEIVISFVERCMYGTLECALHSTFIHGMLNVSAITCSNGII